MTIKDKTEMIKRLREETSAKIKDCISALRRANYCYPDALVWLKIILSNSPCAYCNCSYLDGYYSHRYLFCDVSIEKCPQKNLIAK